jgi:hypothetical protein
MAPVPPLDASAFSGAATETLHFDASGPVTVTVWVVDVDPHAAESSATTGSQPPDLTASNAKRMYGLPGTGQPEQASSQRIELRRLPDDALPACTLPEVSESTAGVYVNVTIRATGSYALVTRLADFRCRRREFFPTYGTEIFNSAP